MGSVYTDAEAKPVGSYPPTGIDVLIVGTGLAGLTASIECVRKGHNVRMLERMDDINTAGDMYFMGHSATQFFRHWPELRDEYEKISMSNAWMETFKHSGERTIPAMKVSDRLRRAGMDPNTPPGTFQMRPLVYGMFVRQVGRLGVQIQFGKRVVGYAEDGARRKAVAITDRGERFEADVVIAADGVGSKSQSLVGGEVRARSSGRAMWRAAFDSKHLDGNADAKEFFGRMAGENNDEPMIRTFLGPGTYALALTRPGTIIWIMNHDVTGSEEESWTHTVESDEVLGNMDKGVGPVPWAPVFKELVRLTPARTILNFELFWRDPQPSWCSAGGRVVQIGDAAHSFLPASGNGATQAIEDAVSLASCLQIGASGASGAAGKEAIPLAVRTHVRLRFVRCACAQKLGFANAELLQDTDWDSVRADYKRAQPMLPGWVWRHDPERYAYEHYAAMADTVRRGVPFDEVDTIPPNYPKGYRYKPWNIDEIIEGVRNGKPVELGEGEWD
ncbi:putative monooxygenase fad-binding protein [Rosellinia necatrix]|uniref:Putative monooxygenase fad-binding protein n=1 Tax=Rosellinia necatrix TaxID=77044 RepID=A0A1W2TKQ7_ROSNE|nr:putative monooxygenase fad-binding protein [Rosellinia necatrix]